jgi:hypothetical protein
MLIGLVQWLATIKGLQTWLKFPWLIAALLSLIVAWIPIVGTIAGIKGAMAAWGWNVWPSIGVFCGPFIIYLIAIAVGGVVDLLRRKGTRSP